MSDPENDDDFDKEIALIQLLGYLELAAEKMDQLRQELDDFAEKMKGICDD